MAGRKDSESEKRIRSSDPCPSFMGSYGVARTAFRSREGLVCSGVGADAAAHTMQLGGGGSRGCIWGMRQE